MGLILCLLAATASLALTRWKPGHGLGFVLAVGCIYGWLRANFLDGLTHFTFDAALAGLYLGLLPRLRLAGNGSSRLATWVLILLAWPVVVILLSPFLDAQHVYVQVAGLRNAVLFVPMLLAGATLSRESRLELGAWAEWCIIGASCFTAGEFLLGLERFYPLNSVTRTLYASNDITGGFFRLPASFPSAHAYGGTMVGLLPLLVARLEALSRWRWLTLLTIGLASLGVFACGARLPVILFGLVAGGSFLRLKRRPLAIASLIGVMAVLGYVVSQSERLRRFETLSDTEMVEQRVVGSVNVSFVELLTEFPMGRGLGSAFGTSVPYFLADYARPPVAIESEYGRLLLEEGLPGLLIWSWFVSLTLAKCLRGFRGLPASMAGSALVIAGSWGAGLIGAGVLASIPGTLLLVMYMGQVWAPTRSVGAARTRSDAPDSETRALYA